MDNSEPTLILASDTRLLTGSTRQLSRDYQAGRLVRLRRGIYVDKDRWLALKPWDRYRLTTAAQAAADPDTVFCF